MFKALQLTDQQLEVTFQIEGQAVHARAGTSVAMAMLEAGLEYTRTTPVSGAVRAPFCLMGACFECLVEVDGQANVQACMLEVRDGMQIRRQCGPRALGDSR